MDTMKPMFIFLPVCAVFLQLASAQDPEIAETILPEIKRVGLRGELRCVVINQLDYPVYWIHRGTDTYISKDDKIEIDLKHNRLDNGHPKYEIERYYEGYNKVIYVLVITRLERRDAGTYTCQIRVRGTTHSPSRNGELIVLVPPSIRKTATTHTLIAREGDALVMTCEAEGYPQPNITWVRVNGGLLPSGKLRHSGSKYSIDSVRTAHRGIFRCLADNAVRPPAVFDTTLRVDFPPVARSVQSSYGQAENRRFDLTIECTITGQPEPDLQWYQEWGDGWRAINNDDKHTVNILLNHANILQLQERWFQLVIRVITANDFGRYKCEGRSKYGTNSAEIWVFPTSECQGPNCPEEQQLEYSATARVGAQAVTIATTLLCALLAARP